MKKLIRQSVSIISYTLILSLLFSVLLFSSCSKSKDNGEDDNGGNVAVTKVSLNKTTLFLAVGGTEILTVTVLPEKATNKTVTWESSNTKVATVSNGTVTAVSEGSATITVKSADGKKSAKCEVTVKANSVPELELNKTILSLEVGAKETLTANTKVTWSSSAPLIATVTENGVVTGIAVGKATITATTEDGKLTAKCEVEVMANSVPELELNKTTLSLEVGAKETLTANTKVTWNSSAPLIASVTTEGVVTGIAVGKATITATTEDGKLTAKCEVEVKAVAVTGIKLSVSETITLAVGGTQTINCTVSPDNAGNKNVKWTTSDNTKVEITSQSNTSVTIKALAEGSATITATTEDGNHTAKCTVKVVAPADFAGEGTEADPYQIFTRKDLETLATKVNGGTNFKDTFFKLMNDIDLGGSASPWTPIGSRDGGTFSGSFDGNSKTISGLYINQPTLDHQALFGFCKHRSGRNLPMIKNLSVTGSVTGNLQCGGIVGYADEISITGCTSDVTVIGKESVGGILGYDFGATTITDCVNKGNVTGDSFVGGVVGLSSSSEISGCSNSGNVTATSYHGGGIAGIFRGRRLFNCSNRGTISGSYYLGGIVGESPGNWYIATCVNAGLISGESYIGGIVGESSHFIVGCYSTGEVNGKVMMGGISGKYYKGQIVACYSTAKVDGINMAGGLVGWYSSGTVNMSYCLNAADGGTDTVVGDGTVGTDVKALSKAAMTDGTMLKDLNTAVDSYNSTKPSEAPTAKKFTKGTDGWPVF